MSSGAAIKKSARPSAVQTTRATAQPSSSDAPSSPGSPAEGPASSAKRSVVLLVVAVGLWSSFAWWSVLQERLLTRPYTMPGGESERFRAPFFLNLVSYCFCVALAGILFPIGRALGLIGGWRTTDLTATVSSGITLGLSTPCGYAAMRRLAYPVVLTAKMCKSIPAMIVGFFVYRQRYSVLKYVGVLLLTFGVLGFSLFDETDAKNSGGKAAASSVVGLALCVVNLVLDGYTQSSQDDIITKSGAGSLQMMILANGGAALCAATLLGLSELVPGVFAATPLLNEILVPHELSSATAFLVRHPGALLDLCNMAALGAVGQVFIFAGISYFGTLTVMGLTVSRKIGSVLISIWLHDHAMSQTQYYCLVIVVAGILLDAYVSVTGKKPKKE